MKAIFKFLAHAFVAGLAGAIVTIFYHSSLKPGTTPSLDLNYVDFLSITLTALSLMITILGFFVAAASVIGWSTIENKLKDHSITYFKEQLSKDGNLRSEFEELISAIAYEGIENIKAQQDAGGGGENEYKD